MQNERSEMGAASVQEPAGKLRWHAPVFKQLDVELTAASLKTNNDPGPGPSYTHGGS